MEHNQKHQDDAAPVFAVAAVLAGPDPESEELFLANELARVDEEIQRRQSRGMIHRAVAAAAKPGLEDYKRYRHDLVLYQQRLRRFVQDMHNGSVPFRIIVTNMGPTLERKIKTTVRVDNGSISLTKLSPERPERVDSQVQQSLEAPSYNLFKSVTGGFVRSDVRMGPSQLTAKFSNLGAGEEAALVNQTLFLEMSPQTVLTFEINSEHHPAVTGDVQL